MGGGNMAAAIIGSQIASRWEPSRITVVDPNAEQRVRLATEHGVHRTDDMANPTAADIIVLEIKPQVFTAVAKQMDADLSGKLILSIAAFRPPSFGKAVAQVQVAKTPANAWEKSIPLI
nr:NAD(P)-binding domain-containing protein [Leisingera sp. ANG-Vp]